MSEINLSVIIPVYNVESYLNACLKSIAGQSLNNLEVIIINDGSTDSSLKIAQKFAEANSHFKLITQDNKGLSAARNRGLETATGEYIAFLDSDDFIDPNMYRSLLNIANESKSDMVKCASVVFEETSKKIIEIKKDFHSFQTIRHIETRFKKYLERDINCMVWNGIYHRSLFNNIRFPEGVNYEDHYVTPQLLSLADKFTYVSEPYVYYRRRAGAITLSYNPKDRVDKLASLNFLFEKLRELNIHNELSKEFTDYFYHILINYHNSSIYKNPKVLSSKKYSAANIINEEVFEFIFRSDQLRKQEMLLLKSMKASHFLYFLAQKTNRLFELANVKKAVDKRTFEQPNNLDHATDKHRQYIKMFC